MNSPVFCPYGFSRLIALGNRLSLSLADYAGGVLFSSCFDTTRYYPILKETTIRFKRFATTDVMVEASFSPEEVERLNKEADQGGKANWVMEFELKDAEGNICCIVKGSFQLRKA